MTSATHEKGGILGARGIFLMLLFALCVLAGDWAAVVICVVAFTDEAARRAGLMKRNKWTESKKVLFDVALLLFLLPAIIFLAIDGGAVSIAVAAALVIVWLGLRFSSGEAKSKSDEDF